MLIIPDNPPADSQLNPMPATRDGSFPVTVCGRAMPTMALRRTDPSCPSFEHLRFHTLKLREKHSRKVCDHLRNGPAMTRMAGELCTQPTPRPSGAHRRETCPAALLDSTVLP